MREFSRSPATFQHLVSLQNVSNRYVILRKLINEHLCFSVSLIECGPVNTNFLVNLTKAELGDPSLQHVDARTLGLYERYLHHCSYVFQNAAQDTEDIVKVKCCFADDVLYFT